MAIPGLIAKKIGMTRVVDSDGKMIAVTLLQVDQQKVTKVCTSEKEGYQAIQVGYYNKKEKQLNKPDVARLRKASIQDNYSRFTEMRTENLEGEFAVGSDLNVSALEGVNWVDITGVSKGRGFQGAVRRWGAATGRRTHGSRFHRRPGSLGQCTTPSRVYKNKHMPGQMGGTRSTVQNLKVVDIDQEKNVIVIRGSVPGFRSGYLLVRPSVKKGAESGN